MYGSLDARKFLSEQEEGSSGGSSSVPAQRSGESTRVSDEQVHRARVAVARGSQDANDCKQLLDMLGLVSDDGGDPPVAR